MLQVERLNRIEKLLRAENMLSATELQETLGVSRATIYRDLKYLSDCGTVKLVRGGATLPQYNNLIVDDEPYAKKIKQYQEEKERIAYRASEYVSPRMTLFLDSSTTVYKMCDHLKKIEDLHVITNDLKIAIELRGEPNVTVFVVGGQLRRTYYTTTIYNQNQCLQGISADICFFASDAININNGFMITNSEESLVKEHMLGISNKHIALCDHSKFEKTAFCSFAPIESADIIITGKELPEELQEKYSKENTELILV